MWKKVQIDGSEFLIKHSVVGNLHKVCLTNLISLWFEDILEENLLCRCKEMNKLVEASDDVFLSHVWSLVESEDCSGSNVTMNLAEADISSKVLTIETRLEGFKFRIKFILAPANNNQFFTEVTQTLLTMVFELDKRQQLLADVIKCKDLEIQEYKLEGGQISRKAVETETFDLEAFSAKCQEQISVSKSRVVACPSSAFTHPVQQLLEKIEAAPLKMLQEIPMEINQTRSKKVMIKLKSPEKNKKQKLYEDEDNDEPIVSSEDIKKEEIKVEKETQQPNKKSSRKVKQDVRLQRALKNL